MKIEQMMETSVKLQAVYCSDANCNCETFVADLDNLRVCLPCGHNILSHESRDTADLNQKRLTLATLTLLGVTAVPIQVKILLERLLSPLSPVELDSILNRVGWTKEDFNRGYILKDPQGAELTNWSTYEPGEDHLLMQKFLNFAETSHLVAPMLSQTGLNGLPPGVRMFPNFLSPPAPPQWLSDNLRLFLQPRFTGGNGVQLPTVLSPPGRSSDRPESNSSASEANSSPTTGKLTVITEEKGDAVDLSQMSSRNETKKSTPTRPQQHSNGQKSSSHHHQQQQQKSLKLPTVSSGKRRVECHQCHKSFCDKGALKIHFSAVHLREMHKCTVAGCTLMFSSRRSRNRHSNNPNPKLHTPVAGSGKKTANFTPTGRVVSPIEAAQEYERMLTTSTSKQQLVVKSEFLPLDLSCRQNSNSSVAGDEESPNGRHNDEEFKSESPDGRQFKAESRPKGDSGDRGSSRKRKNINPTRCVPTATLTTPTTSSKVAKLDESFDDEEDLMLDDSQNHSDCDSLTVSNCCTTPPMLYSADDISDDCQSDRSECQSIDLSQHQSAIDKLASMTSNFPQLSQIDYRSALNHTDLDSLRGEQNGVGSAESGLKKSNSTPSGSAQLRSLPPISMQICKTPNGTVEIPINEENPRMCAACDKLFQNHFSVKTHYQNVHLKLQHSCTVDGCTATFPSKRSRDRHSGNLNLHRKLLSTGHRSTSPTVGGDSGEGHTTPAPCKVESTPPLDPRQAELLRNFYALNATFNPGLIGPFNPNGFPSVFGPNQNFSAFLAGQRLLPFLTSPGSNGVTAAAPIQTQMGGKTAPKEISEANKRETVATQ